MCVSLDYMYYKWKNCHVGWQGQFQNKDEDMSIILEPIVDQPFRFDAIFLGFMGATMTSMFLDQSPSFKIC